ncbi:MAG: hypothetical protein KGI97_07385 [Alphaproteobacteria bacterium]|nr:hypothetical protein [Alphaproteobacteria bacterium]
MERLKQALEDLDEAIFALEDRLTLEASQQREAAKKQAEIAKQSHQREVEVLAVAQKVAARLDHTIEHVERIVRH